MTRIKLLFRWDKDLAAKVKAFPGVRWSSENKCWHIPYSKEAFDAFKKEFPDVDYSGADIVVTETPRQLYIELPKNETDSQFIRSFRYYRWDAKRYCWVIPNWGTNLELIKSYFKDRKVRFERNEPLVFQDDAFLPEYKPYQMLVVNVASRQLKIYLAYKKDVAARLRKIPLIRWHHTAKVFEQLPQADQPTGGEKTQIKQQFLVALPPDFDKQTALATAQTLGISASTAERQLQKWCACGKLRHPKHGEYSKPEANSKAL